MDYLDHLGRVVDKTQRKVDISTFELEIKCQLPKLLKMFYLIYQVNDLSKYKKGSHIDFNYLIWDNKRQYSIIFTLFTSPLKESGYNPEQFYEFKDIKNVIANFFNDDYETMQKDFIVIGETSWHFPIMIGINEANTDQVFVYDLDKEKLEYLADNIFEYLMQIELDFSNNYNLPEGKTVNDLYKNWNEDFWRIRE